MKQTFLPSDWLINVVTWSVGERTQIFLACVGALRRAPIRFEHFGTFSLASRQQLVTAPSGRKNVLRKLLRIPYRRLKAGIFCALTVYSVDI